MILPAIMGATARRFDPDTVLLLPMTGADESTTFTDIAKGGNAPHTVTANGDAQIDTAVADPFSVSGGVGTFDGTGDYLTFPNNADFAFGTQDFTIEWWVNAPLNSDKFFIGGRQAIGSLHITTGGFGGTTAGALRCGADVGNIVSTTVVTDNTWHHCAIVRASGTVNLFVDGTLEASISNSENYSTNTGTWYIARNDSLDGNYLTGYLSDLRISKGVARYTANFTPPARLKP